MLIDSQRLHDAYEIVRARLLAEREAAGHWVGRLASSALSTATAVSALALLRRDERAAAAIACDWGRLVDRGVEWILARQNRDGGWGDTDLSYSNVATTMLVVAAVRLAGKAEACGAAIARAERYVQLKGGIAGLRARYGRDKTFAVPILTNCALAGFVPWREVTPLPFEAAVVPQRWYRFLQLPVVSYAIPALVAIGQARFFHVPPRFPLAWLVRRAAVQPSLRVLERMQPESGGYLEAVPLTSFVVMALAGMGRACHPVALRGARFLVASVRQDGSWPIDSNLATWNTTLALSALAAGGDDFSEIGPQCVEWLLSCQHRSVHPFTGARPGGWGWSDLSGAVPDADDTPGALLALAALRRSPAGRRWPAELDQRVVEAATQGVAWLLDLQNRDGGWPTFCRGWGRLPFDRSGADLTAHAVRALDRWLPQLPERLARRARKAIRRGFAFLLRHQRGDGAWVPLWFGNQDDAAEENPVYGTARVLLAYSDCGRSDTPEARRGLNWLIRAQNADGGWGGGRSLIDHGVDPDVTLTDEPWRERAADRDVGRDGRCEAGAREVASVAGGDRRERQAVGPSSVEETALAVDALLAAGADVAQGAIGKGLQWLCCRVEDGGYERCWPIGFYFAKLWYYEKLYPLIFTASALGRAVRSFRGEQVPGQRGATARLVHDGG